MGFAIELAGRRGTGRWSYHRMASRSTHPSILAQQKCGRSEGCSSRADGAEMSSDQYFAVPVVVLLKCVLMAAPHH